MSVTSLFGLLQEGDDGQDQENNKKDFGDPCSGACDETESRDGGDDGDGKKNEGILERIIWALV